MDTTRSFVVEHAGCPACAERVRAALEPLAAVEDISVDEGNDLARVRLANAGELSEERANEALAAASAGSGHEYRVQPGSWAHVRRDP